MDQVCRTWEVPGDMAEMAIRHPHGRRRFLRRASINRHNGVIPLCRTDSANLFHGSTERTATSPRCVLVVDRLGLERTNKLGVLFEPPRRDGRDQTLTFNRVPVFDLAGPGSA